METYLFTTQVITHAEQIPRVYPSSVLLSVGQGEAVPELASRRWRRIRPISIAAKNIGLVREVTNVPVLAARRTYCQQTMS